MLRSIARFVRTHPLFAVTVVAALYHFLRLGSTDLREWDEAVYSIRVLSVLQHGAWLDQTADAIGGLWSSSHPPLAIWAMALAARFLGLSEWSLRVPSALCGVGCIVVLYGLARGLGRSRDLVPATAVGLALLPAFTRYARMAQLDAPVLFWMLLCVFWFWKAGTGSWAWYAASGVALGAGLLTKIVVALLAPMSLALFVALGLVRRRDHREPVGRDAVGLIAVLGIGLAIATPWFLMMLEHHGASFWDQFAGYHVLRRMATPLEGHGSSLGVWFYVQEILKAFGVLVPLVVLGMDAWHRRGGSVSRNRRFLLAWFLVPFIVFSFTSTKLGTYVVLMLAPLVLYAGIGIRAFRSDGASPRLRAVVLPLAIAAIVFQQTSPLQRGVEDWVASIRHVAAPPGEAIAFTGFLALTAVLAVLCVRGHASLGVRGRARWHAVTCVVLGLGALVPSLAPLTSTRTSWIRTQASARAMSPDRVVLVGDESAVNRYYLQSMRGRTEIDWQILASDAFGAEAASAACGPQAVLILQRGRGDGTPVEPECEERLRTEELVLFTSAP